MAMSLEDLLAKEGFKRRKEKIKPRISSASQGTTSTPLFLQQAKNESGSSSMAVKRPERARSHIPRYDPKGEFSTSSSFTGRKPRDNLAKMHLESEKRNSLNYERRGRQDSWNAKRFSISSSKDLRVSEINEVAESDEIVDVGINRPYKDRYSNEVYSHNRDNKNNSFKHSYLDHKSTKDANDSKRINFGESRTLKQDKLDDGLAIPALDEAAVKAVISILSGYAKRVVEDEDFRTSLHHNCFVSLNLIGLDEGLNTQSKVIGNLEQAIEIVERAAEDQANLKELKKASLQLSVITGLNSDDLKEGFTSGIPNTRLSACAHLYLSVIYVIQKKDGISAKHLLQVFCNSPFQARTTLLPELWDHVFLPHLLHLKLWYEKETHSKVVEKVYNESLDSGTYEFAMYYKDWIMDGVEAPSVPLIRIPSFPIRKGGLLGHTSSPSSHAASPQSMVSKQLYDEVFRHSHKGGTDLVIYDEENVESPATEDKQLILYTRDSLTQSNKSAGESPSDNYISVADEEQISHTKSSLGEANLQINLGACQGHLRSQYILPSHTQIEDSFNHHVASETEQVPSPAQDIKDIPEDFLCPLTGLLFKDPVTLETGQTFEREAITDWFDQGFITCPVTRKALQYKAVPPTNLILKRVINKWKRDHIDHLLATLSEVAAAGSHENAHGDDNMIICVLGQLLPAFSKDERITNGRRVISCGGLEFLVRRFAYANAREKIFILSLLCCCIEADGGCRNDIARNINLSDLLQLLCDEELESRTSTVLLLIELICFNRRSRAKFFLEGLIDEEIISTTLDHLSTYLQTCPLEQTPLVAVLILNLDLLLEQDNNKIYRQEAIDSLALALTRSIADEKVEKKCCRALLILGGFFSSSGKLMTEDWILKLAGFLNGPDGDIADDESNDISADGIVITTVDTVSEDEEEESAREKWLVMLSASLVEDGSKSFLDAVCKCVSLGKSDLVRVCLTTVAWLSFSLASLDDNGFQIRALLALVSPLKQCLEFGELAEHKILASLSLYNFSTIPECRRILVMKIGEEVGPCLEKLGVVTWTAKELYSIIISQQRR